jgi:cupin fold WbuC family metalloprotein
MQHVNRNMVDDLFKEAQASDRRRAFHRFHGDDDMFNRMLIAGTTGSYAAPHRHAEKFEAFAPVEGGVIVVEFNDSGKPINAYDLRQVPYVELGPMTWHTLVYVTDRWAVMEFALWKEKYDPTDKEFAPWAPKEGDPAAAEYLKKLTAAVTKLAKKSS